MTTMQPNHPRRRGSVGLAVVKGFVFLLGTVLFTGGIFVAAWWLTGPGNVMADQVRIGPIDVSGRSQEAAREAIITEVEQLTATTVPVELAEEPPQDVPDDQVTTSAEPTLSELGVEAAVDEAIERAWQVGRSGDFEADLDARIRAFSDSWLIVALPLTIDEPRLEGVSTRIADELSWESREADVVIDTGEPSTEITEGYVGGSVEGGGLRAELADTVRRVVNVWEDTWTELESGADGGDLGDRAATDEIAPIEIATEEIGLEVTTEEVEEIAAEAEQYWEAGYEFLEPEIDDDGNMPDDPFVGDSAPDDAVVVATLLPSQIASMITIDITADEPISFDADQLVEWVERAAGGEPEEVWYEDPENATVGNVSASWPSPNSDNPESTDGISATAETEPSTDGWVFDAETLVETVTGSPDSDERVRTLPYEVVEPDVSSDDVEPLTEPTPIGTFTTFYNPGEERNLNIQRFAELVDGAEIPPGGEIELNDIVGPRTEENGFVSGGAIEDGEFVQVTGGGVSQFATTFYNAAYFSGVDLLEHQPHSYYIDRYPIGRESTINYGSIDVRVGNPSDAPVFVLTDWTDDSVTTTFFGEPFADVEFSSGEPTNQVSGSVRDGFDIEYFRTRTWHDNGESEEERFFHRYQPED